MPWKFTEDIPEMVGTFRKKPTGKILRKPIKKYNPDGTPDLTHWGSGMYAIMNSQDDLGTPNLKFKEAYPKHVSSQETTRELVSKPVSSMSVRTYELWKEPNQDFCKIILGGTSELEVDNLSDSLDMESKPIKETVPDFFSRLDDYSKDDYRWWCISIEQSHQINFTTYDTRQLPIIDQLIRTITSDRVAGIFFQMCWFHIPELSTICETSANNLSTQLNKWNDGLEINRFDGLQMAGKIPIPRMRKETIRHPGMNTTVYEIGRQVKPLLYTKSHQQLSLLSIRCFVLTNESSSIIQSIRSIFQNVVVNLDSLDTYECTDPRVIDVLKNRTPSSSESLDILEKNTKEWFDSRWEIGNRDLCPNLVLTQPEMKIFISSPTDSNLKVQFVRQSMKGMSVNIDVLSLGTEYP